MTIQITMNFDSVEATIDALTKLGGTPSTVDVSAAVIGPAATGSPIPTTTVTPAPSSATTKYAEESNVDLSTVIGTGKDGRIVKADVTAAAQSVERPAPAPEPENDDPFALDDDPAPEAVTREQVQAALVSYQSALRDKKIAAGVDEGEAKKDAMATARSLLETISGANTLGGLDESMYAKVKTAADTAKGKL